MNYECEQAKCGNNIPKPQHCKCNNNIPKPQHCKCNNNIPKPDKCNCEYYVEISQQKCKEATCLNEEANEVAECAAQLEAEAEALVYQANNLICEAQKCWDKYSYLTQESEILMQEAQEALNAAIACQKKCNRPSNHNNCMPCNETYPPPCKGPSHTPCKNKCCR